MIYDGIDIEVSAKTPLMLVGQFEAGAYANGLSYLTGEVSGSCSLTTYDTLEDFLASKYRAEIANGAYVIDKRRCGDDGVSAVYSGPMVDCRLPERTVSEMFEKPHTFESIAEALSYPGTNRGMTMVSLDIHAALWRQLGARIGRMRTGTVVWEGQ